MAVGLDRVILTPEEDKVKVRDGSSVCEHRFGVSEPYTLGIEEEYMLLDHETFDLVQRAETILHADNEDEFAARTSCELFQSEIEGQTPVCSDVACAKAELGRLR